MTTRILAACLLAAASVVWAQPIYKVVDENGNVTYTDQKPSDDAEPMDLPELNVLDSQSEPPTISTGQDAPEVEPLRLEFVSPQDEEHIFGTGNTLDVALEANIEIPATALVVFYLDGEAQEPVQSLRHSFEFIPRGPHTLSAQLQTVAGRVLAETETITFYMRQASRLNPPGQ